MALDCSCVDYPLCAPDELHMAASRRPDWLQRTWGRRGLENILDTILATGCRRVHFRSHCAGPWWPTRIADAAPGSVGTLLDPSFSDWNPVAEAVQIAHDRGMRILGWFDLTEGHAGYPTAWSLRHPEFCIVDREGHRLDGPGSLTGRDGTRFDPARHIGYRDLIREGFMDEECERPDGAPIDPHLSLAYPQVVEYRLALLAELMEFGVDGVYLTANSCVGYEEPVTRSFREKYSVDPRELEGEDPRWVRHQRGYFTSFLRKVSRLVRVGSGRGGQRLELVLEGQGTEGTGRGNEPGWSNIPGWAATPGFVDVEGIAREELVDGICFWTFREMDALSSTACEKIDVLTRYRFIEGEFSESGLRTRMAEARKRGAATFILNEPRVPLLSCDWIYPGAPGPLHKIIKGQN